MIIDQKIGRNKKKKAYFVIDERLIMRVYLYLEKWDYIDEMQRNRIISTQTGIMLIGEKDGENSAVRTNEMEISFFLFQIKHARCRTTLLMLDTVLFFFTNICKHFS